MTNPTPRPALRKAEDATVHPAAPRPARSPRAAATKQTEVASAPGPVAAVPTAPAPAAAPAPAPRKSVKPAKQSRPRPMPPVSGHGKRGKRKFGGATSDHLRVDPDAVPETGADRKGAKGTKPTKPAAAEPVAVAVPTQPTQPTQSTKPAKPSRKRARLATRDDLMQGKPVDLDVSVPKALRKAARDRAKAEGLDLQTVVIDALHAYVTRPPL